MKHFRIINKKKEYIDTKRIHYTRYSLRNELGEDLDIDYYNSINLERNRIYFPYKLKYWYNYISIFVSSVGLSFVFGLALYLYLDSLIISFLTMFSLTFVVLTILESRKLNKGEQEIVDEFNNLYIKDLSDVEWIEPDANGDRYIIFKSFDYDVDHKQLKLNDLEYSFLKKYRYEIEHNERFNSENYIYEDLYDKAEDTLYKDLKDNNVIEIDLV